ncbi:MAG: 30S ribosomal protein S24e [Methanobacteriaceae archaeon]|nr:30S ribosomal protein S24e [Methanobacteriaceae archaeon]
MEINIKDQKENKLLNRTEIQFDCIYQGEATPRILDVKNKLVAMLNAKKELLVIDQIKPSFGEGRANGYAKLYDSQESLADIETNYIIEKNKEPQKEEAPEEE